MDEITEQAEGRSSSDYSLIPAKDRNTEQRNLRALHLRTVRRAKQAVATSKILALRWSLKKRRD